jgi:hypothetical protein
LILAAGDGTLIVKTRWKPSPNMSLDFIIIPRGPEPAPADTSPSALAKKWFASVHGIAPETAERLREQVQHKLETGACRNLLPKWPEKSLRGFELQMCVEQVITEQWDSLSADERLLVRFPPVQAVGQTFEIPNRGTGVIIHRELTRRFSIEMTFQLKDGSFFTREFID